MDERTLDLLREARAAERAQARFYRALAAEASLAGDRELEERLNGLHADEQHHLSRLSARLLELGESTGGESAEPVDVPPLSAWEAIAREREHAEVRRYEALLERPLDRATEALVTESLETERRHADRLGGKWTPA